MSPRARRHLADGRRPRRTTWVRCVRCGGAHKLIRCALLDVIACPAAEPGTITVYRQTR